MSRSSEIWCAPEFVSPFLSLSLFFPRSQQFAGLGMEWDGWLKIDVFVHLQVEKYILRTKKQKKERKEEIYS